MPRGFFQGSSLHFTWAYQVTIIFFISAAFPGLPGAAELRHPSQMLHTIEEASNASHYKNKFHAFPPQQLSVGAFGNNMSIHPLFYNNFLMSSTDSTFPTAFTWPSMARPGVIITP